MRFLKSTGVFMGASDFKSGDFFMPLTKCQLLFYHPVLKVSRTGGAVTQNS